ncbi:MAG: SRPBCC family protein [Gammaproteobacteria bacterium]
MTEFSLTSIWQIPAPVETVWSCLIDTEAWPLWWSYVDTVTEIDAGEPSGLGNIRQYLWRTCLPYCLRLRLRVTEIRFKRTIAVEVSGDLRGDGRCQLKSLADNRTQVVFYWHVNTCIPWMAWFSTLTRPVFEWNHANVMKQGERGLSDYITSRRN